MTIIGVESVAGGSGSDVVTFVEQVTSAILDLGTGSDRLTLADFDNTITIKSIETVIGGSQSDTIQLSRRLDRRLHRPRQWPRCALF